jgi:hypothetical protein
MDFSVKGVTGSHFQKLELYLTKINSDETDFYIFKNEAVTVL